MFILAIFVQKVDFERCQFQREDMALSKFYLFVVMSFGVLGESCSKAPEVRLGKCFYHWMFIFANFVQKIGFEQSQLQGVGVAVAEFYLFELR